jgi:hypothetical protein
MPVANWLTDPSSHAWQWANIAMGAVGLLVASFTYFQAKSARRAAEDASRAATHISQEYQLTDLQEDLIELQQFVEVGVISGHVTTRLIRLRARLRELRQRVAPNEGREAILENLDVANELLGSIAKEAVNPRTQTATKVERIVGSLGEAISAVSDAIGLHRRKEAGV